MMNGLEIPLWSRWALWAHIKADWRRFMNRREAKKIKEHWESVNGSGRITGL